MACPHLSTKKLATNRTCIHYLDVWFRWVEEAEGLVAGVEEVLVNPDPAVPTLVAANLQPLDIKENNVQALKITSDPVGTWKCNLLAFNPNEDLTTQPILCIGK